MAISRGETTTRPVGRALPTWYDDAKFGIFIHWGPFAIPGFAPVDNDDEVSFTEYFAYWMNVPGSATARFHAREYGDLPYEAFAERFRAGVPLWDPDEWAELFERAGARYVVLTAKTDDGFLVWPSAHPNPRKAGWQVQRDLIGELAAAVRGRAACASGSTTRASIGRSRPTSRRHACRRPRSGARWRARTGAS